MKCFKDKTMYWREKRYNKKSAKKYGWHPFWFNAEAFDDILVENIKYFQAAHGLEVDGMCGPATYRRVFTKIEQKFDPNGYHNIIQKEATNYILCDGREASIHWDKVKIDLLPESCYKKQKKLRHPTMVVTHWDAALSANSCRNILKKRGISSHFVIDNDGTIVQLVDTNHIAWHAGIRRVNNASVGIDFSNAVYTKYNKTYEKRGHGPRPIIKNFRVHGRRLSPFLGYYPEQIQAYKALLKTLNDNYAIPLVCPVDESGSLITTVVEDARKARFKGVVNHYNLTKKKWDASGLQLNDILEELNTN